MDNMSTMSDFKDKVESGQFDRERDEFRENMYKELIEQRDSIISMLLESHPDLNIQPILNLERSDLMFWIAEVISHETQRPKRCYHRSLMRTEKESMNYTGLVVLDYQRGVYNGSYQNTERIL
jgi:hypothetical protein